MSRITVKIVITVLVLLGGMVFGSEVVIAQEVDTIPSKSSSPKAPRTAKKTTINFEDELIEGEVKKPELLYLLQQKQFNFKRLIKLRENFLPEMKQTAEDLK